MGKIMIEASVGEDCYAFIVGNREVDGESNRGGIIIMVIVIRLMGVM